MRLCYPYAKSRLCTVRVNTLNCGHDYQVKLYTECVDAVGFEKTFTKVTFMCLSTSSLCESVDLETDCSGIW